MSEPATCLCTHERWAHKQGGGVRQNLRCWIATCECEDYRPAEDRPTLARVPLPEPNETKDLPIGFGWVRVEDFNKLQAAYDALAQQLQQAQAQAADYLDEGRRMALQVEELQEQLQQAQEEVDDVREQLNSSRDHVAELAAKVVTLTNDLAATVKAKAKK